jgi:hypothetical protein
MVALGVGTHSTSPSRRSILSAAMYENGHDRSKKKAGL